MSNILPVERFLQTLDIVHREAGHLRYSWKRLYTEPIDAAWVKQLEARPELAERVEAFASRFGRIQDTIADKLLPRWLAALAETPGSQIETLNRSEKLGVVADVERWLEARKLRNRLVHDYMENEQEFAESLITARDYCTMFYETYNSLRDFSATRMSIPESRLPQIIVYQGNFKD